MARRDQRPTWEMRHRPIAVIASVTRRQLIGHVVATIAAKAYPRRAMTRDAMSYGTVKHEIDRLGYRPARRALSRPHGVASARRVDVAKPGRCAEAVAQPHERLRLIRGRRWRPETDRRRRPATAWPRSASSPAALRASSAGRPDRRAGGSVAGHGVFSAGHVDVVGAMRSARLILAGTSLYCRTAIRHGHAAQLDRRPAARVMVSSPPTAGMKLRRIASSGELIISYGDLPA